MLLNEFCGINAALREVRKQTEALRIQKERQEQGLEGEVDVESIDWLYGTYKMKDEMETTDQEVCRHTKSRSRGFELPKWKNTKTTIYNVF